MSDTALAAEASVSAPRTGPLTGVRVIDFSQAVAGPFAGRLLSDLGADVIKVEPPTGDLSRKLTTVGDGEFSAMFNHANAGKRSIVIDVKAPEGLEIARALVRGADIVVENLAPGVMSRLGLGYDDLIQLTPDLIMCSVSSYGQYGSYSGYVGADPVGQAMSGMVAMTGDPDRPPYMLTTGIADTSTGTHAALAILAALLDRHRTGKGCHLDISMCGVMLLMDCCNVPLALASRGAAPMERSGPHNLTVSPFGVFAAQEGYVLIEAWGEGENSLWGRLCHVMRHPALIDDVEFRTNEARRRNRLAVTALIETWLASMPRDEAMQLLYEARVVAAPVLTPYEAVCHPVATERGMAQTVTVAGHDEIEVLASPYRGVPWGTVTKPSPLHGEHSCDIASGEAGVSVDRVAELVASGVLQQYGS